MWFKIDDGFYDHPKVEDLEPSAVGLWTLCGTYAARHLTDGHVAKARIRRFGGTEEDAAALVAAGLWAEVEGGYQFHDWADHQPSRAEVEEKREQERTRKARQRRRNDGQFTSEKDTPHPSQGVLPVSQRDTPRDSAGTPAGVTPSRPDPTRPDQEKSGAQGGRKKPSTSIPSNWTPTDSHQAKAAELGVNLAREAESFKLHAEATDRRLADWNKGFFQWLLKAHPAPQRYAPTTAPRVGEHADWMIPRSR